MPETLTFGRIKKPAVINRHIAPSGPNTAFDYLGPNLDIGACVHRAVGTAAGTAAYFANEARHTALTNIIIGGPWDGALNGKILEFIPDKSGIAPWANGAADDLEGDGIAYVRKMGVASVNRDLKSIELSDGGNINNPFGPTETPLQWHSLVHYLAWVFDQAKVPWDKYPIHPVYDICTFLFHYEFSSKGCPFPPVIAKVDLLHNTVRGMLKEAQTESSVVSPITAIPVLPVPGNVVSIVPYSTRNDERLLKARFGEVKGDDGLMYRYDPKGTISNAWIARSMEEKEFPRIASVETTGGIKYVSFQNGWVLIDIGNDKASWFWAGEKAA